MKRNPFAKMRAKRREMPSTELSLAAMVDMMINILIFLLVLYGRGTIEELPSEDLKLAKSTATQTVRASVTVVLTRRSIELGGAPVLYLADAQGVPQLPEEEMRDGHLPELTQLLEEKRLQAEGKPLPEGQVYVPELLVETDKRVPWSVLGPVLRSGAKAGFEQYRFVVAMKGSGGQPPP